jgi:hypothetical protein
LRFCTEKYHFLVGNAVGVILVQYIDETEDQAMEALRTNEYILRRLTDELLARIKISGFVSLVFYFCYAMGKLFVKVSILD